MLVIGALRWKYLHSYFILYSKIINQSNQSKGSSDSAWRFFNPNTYRPRQNDPHLVDNIFNHIFFSGNVWILIKISLEFVSNGLINNIAALGWIGTNDCKMSLQVTLMACVLLELYGLWYFSIALHHMQIWFNLIKTDLNYEIWNITVRPLEREWVWLIRNI